MNNTEIQKTAICKQCGNEMDYQVNKKYCNDCMHKRRIEYQAGYRKKQNTERKKTGRKYVTCLCPMCRKLHSVRMEYGWKGNGTARIYCEDCKETKGIMENRMCQTVYQISL